MACPLHTNVIAGKGKVNCGRLAALPGAGGQRFNSVICAYDKSSKSSTSTTTIDSMPSTAATSTIRVKVTPPRPASQPPSPPSLIHSPVYVQRALIKTPADSAVILPSSSSVARLAELDDEQDVKDSNSLLWALKQVDRSLDELEHNPLPLQKQMYELSRSPVGNATSSAFSTAAKVTVAATKEAVKAAVPVGQWMVKEGAKAAVSLMSRAMAESAKLQQQQQGAAGKQGQVKKVNDGRKK